MEIVSEVRSARTGEDLAHILRRACVKMGFRYFALTHHVDFGSGTSAAVRLHNYPPEWVRYFDAAGLGVSDPVHRASHVTNASFTWSTVPQMIKLTAGDREVFTQAAANGIGDGCTVPAHVPGEASGSCSFAVAPGDAVPADALEMAQLVGAFAFDAARQLFQIRAITTDRTPVLTDRQRDCVLWTARGKNAWETSRILGISYETVVQHLKMARERYDVQKASELTVRALYDGLICFADIYRR